MSLHRLIKLFKIADAYSLENSILSLFIKKAMAISDIPYGIEEHEAGTIYDAFNKTFECSNVLTPQQRQNGFSLKLETNGTFRGINIIDVKLFHNGSMIGECSGFVRQNNILEPHAAISNEYKGQGFGKKMYEALYSYALKNNIRGVKGHRGGTTIDAARVHLALTRAHKLSGFEPKPSLENGYIEPYSYTLESDPNYSSQEKDNWIYNENEVKNKQKEKEEEILNKWEQDYKNNG